MAQAMPKWKDYLKALKKSNAESIIAFVNAAEKKIDKDLVGDYKKLSVAMFKLFLASYAFQIKETLQLGNLLGAKKIPVNVWAKYTVLNSHILPVMSIKKQDKKEEALAHLRASANAYMDAVKSLDNAVKQESSSLYHEGIIKSIFGGVANVIWKTVSFVGAHIGKFGAHLINTYNSIFDFITMPVKKLVAGLPMGDMLLDLVSYPVFFALNSVPGLAFITRIHTTLSNPVVKGGASAIVHYRGFMNSMNEAMKDIGDLAKDINMEDIEAIYEKKENDETTASEPENK